MRSRVARWYEAGRATGESGGCMDWKTYYRKELTSAGSRSRLCEWLEEDPDERIATGLGRGAVISFPHTAIVFAGPLQSAIVSALYRGSIERIVALGVLHSGGLPAYCVALDERRPSKERESAFVEVCGGFGTGARRIDTPFGTCPTIAVEPSEPVIRTDSVGILDGEFSLDTFLSIMRLAADVFGTTPIPVECLFIGMTRHPISGAFEMAPGLAKWLRDRVADSSTAVVATGDLVHYGTAYGLPEQEAEMVDDRMLDARFRSELEITLGLAMTREGFQEAYRRSKHVLRNDQREMLPVIAEYLGEGARFEILRFELSDYAGILARPTLNLVASSLVVYG